MSGWKRTGPKPASIRVGVSVPANKHQDLFEHLYRQPFGTASTELLRLALLGLRGSPEAAPAPAPAASPAPPVIAAQAAPSGDGRPMTEEERNGFAALAGRFGGDNDA